MLRSQRGLITTAQLALHGAGTAHRRTLVSQGHLVPMGRGVLRSVAVEASWEQLVLGRILGHGGEALACSTSAPRLWRLEHADQHHGIHLLTAYSTGARQPGVHVHRTKLLVTADRAEVGGVPVTSPARTIADATARPELSDRQLHRWIDDLRRRRLLEEADLVEVAERLRPGPGRSVRRLRRLVGWRAGERPDVGDSAPEVAVADWMAAAGFPRPALGIELRLRDGRRVVVDGGWMPEEVGFEYQSRAHHGPEQVQRVFEDEARLTALRSIGWDVYPIRTGATRAEVVELLGGAMGRRRRERSRSA